MAPARVRVHVSVWALTETQTVGLIGATEWLAVLVGHVFLRVNCGERSLDSWSHRTSKLLPLVTQKTKIRDGRLGFLPALQVEPLDARVLAGQNAES